MGDTTDFALRAQINTLFRLISQRNIFNKTHAHLNIYWRVKKIQNDSKQQLLTDFITGSPGLARIQPLPAPALTIL